MLFEAMRQINELEAAAPVKVGDVIKADFITKGVNLIAAKTIEK